MSAKVKRIQTDKSIDGFPIFRHVTQGRGRPHEDVRVAQGRYVPIKEYRNKKAAEAKAEAKAVKVAAKAEAKAAKTAAAPEPATAE